MLARILVSLLAVPEWRGEEPAARIRRWLTETEVGRQWVQYLSEEAELLEMAANRLNLSGDEELREIARELGRSAQRLQVLARV